MTESLDQIALDLGCPPSVLLRQLQFLPSQFCRRRGNRGKIDVWPAGQSDTPMRDRALWVNLGCGLKRADGFAVVEPVIKSEALVKVTLRLWRSSGDLPLVTTEPLEERFLRPNDAG